MVEVAVAVLVQLVQQRLLQLLALAGLEQHRQFLVQARLMAVAVAVAPEQVQQVDWAVQVVAAMVQ
jgi:hypothetical protein